MDVLVKINNKNNVEYYSNYADGFILGLKAFSVDYYEFDLSEIKDIISCYVDKSFFVAINKNIFNNELDKLESVLIELDKINIKGILFYDMSILYLKNKNKLNIDLVWNQTHMVTNYNTCNYYYSKGVNYAFVSGEITLEEIIELSRKTNSNLMVQVVGHQVMAHSRRKLLSNYYASKGERALSLYNFIKERDEEYIVKENASGATFKTGKILNAIPYIEQLRESNISYVVVDEDFIDKEIIKECLILISEINKEKNIKENIDKGYKLIGEWNSFLFKKTIFKVKKGDK